ncbi:MAG TPA: hypothetical protein VGR68_06790 [Actinomycetota bacterium]|jgi:hypothetical protein|nr:hypothetical protein [Actinomycetota bacterium]
MMRRHELDPISLVFGFAVTGLGLLFLVGRADVAYRLRWVWPVLLLAVGLAMLLDLRVRASRPEEPATAPPSASTPAEPGAAEPSEPGDEPVEERDAEPEPAEASPPSDRPERG